jgi:hypothetical protein
VEFLPLIEEIPWNFFRAKLNPWDFFHIEVIPSNFLMYWGGFLERDPYVLRWFLGTSFVPKWFLGTSSLRIWSVEFLPYILRRFLRTSFVLRWFCVITLTGFVLSLFYFVFVFLCLLLGWSVEV